MRIKQRDPRSAFTRLDLLVALVVISVALAVIVVMVARHREQANVAECAEKLHTLASATLHYEERNREYPGYLNVVIMRDGNPYVDAQTGKRRGASFVVPLLADLGRPDHERAWHAPPNDPRMYVELGPGPAMPAVVCPLAPPEYGWTQLSYIANCGMADWAGSAEKPRDWPDNGVFFDRYSGDPRVVEPDGPRIPIVTMTNEFISRGDGVTATLMFSENVDAGNYTDTSEAALGMLWNASGKIDNSRSPPSLRPPSDRMRINHATGEFEALVNADMRAALSERIEFARPSSYHRGGVNVVFCDGHTRFLSQDIDYYIYCMLMSTNGNRVRLPGSDSPLPGFSPFLNAPLCLGSKWTY